MRSRNDYRIANLLLAFIFSMLVPMILSTRVLKSGSYLGMLYIVGYAVMLIAFCMTFSVLPIRISKYDATAWMIYVVILVFPFVNDVIKGISINYFDPVNNIVKIVNLFIFYMAMKGVKINKNALCRFFSVIVIISVFACVFSILFEYSDILSIRFTTNTNSLNIKSFFSNRNQYSAFLIIALTSLLYLQQIKKRKMNILILVLQIFCILTTFSRAALFSMIIIIGLFVMQKKSVKKKIVVLSLIVVLGLVLIYNTGIIDVFLIKYLRWEQSADSGRFILWRYAWDIAKENYITGVGFYTGVDIAVSKGMKLTQFHNMFFDLLVDGGVFEILFILGVFYSVYKRCSRMCPDKQLLAVYRSSFVAFVFHACVESLSVLALSYGDNLYSVFFISVPLLLSNLKEEQNNNTDDIQKNNFKDTIW